MIHLDTTFLISALVPGSSEDHRLRRWSLSGEIIGLRAIVWAEFLCGPLDAHHGELVKVVARGSPYPSFPTMRSLLRACSILRAAGGEHSSTA